MVQTMPIWRRRTRLLLMSSGVSLSYAGPSLSFLLRMIISVDTGTHPCFVFDPFRAAMLLQIPPQLPHTRAPRTSDVQRYQTGESGR